MVLSPTPHFTQEVNWGSFHHRWQREELGEGCARQGVWNKERVWVSMGIYAVSLERTHILGHGPSSGEAAFCVGPAGLLCSLLAAGQLVEQVLIECFILVLGAGGQENVASNVLMHDFAICTQAGECNGDVLVKLDSHLEGEGTGTLKTDKNESKRSRLAGDGPELRTAEVLTVFSKPHKTPLLASKLTENHFCSPCAPLWCQLCHTPGKTLRPNAKIISCLSLFR